MTIHSMTGCVHPTNIRNSNTPPTDICTSGIVSFSYSEEELNALSRKNKENALAVNCTLYFACGFEVPNASVCEPR